MRLVGRPLEVYQYLEPLYNDYRKVRTSGGLSEHTGGSLHCGMPACTSIKLCLAFFAGLGY